MKYTLIAWDFDGTLFNSVPRVARSLQLALADMGVWESEENTHRRIALGSMQLAATEYAGAFHLDFDALVARFRFYQRPNDCVDDVLPFPGAGDILSRIQASGRKNCLYTLRGETAYTYLDAHGLLGYFDRCITALDGFPPKPDPTALRALLAETGTAPERLLMVGDREMDLLSAKGAGAHACLHNTNRLTPPPSADYVITALPQLWPLL